MICRIVLTVTDHEPGQETHFAQGLVDLLKHQVSFYFAYVLSEYFAILATKTIINKHSTKYWNDYLLPEGAMHKDNQSFEGKVLENFSKEFGKGRTLLWRLFTSPEVPAWVKVIPVLSFLYWISPFDALIPIVGVTPIDDFAAIVVGLKLLVELSPQDLVDRLRDEINYGISADDNDGSVIDTTYRVLDDDS